MLGLALTRPAARSAVSGDCELLFVPASDPPYTKHPEFRGVLRLSDRTQKRIRQGEKELAAGEWVVVGASWHRGVVGTTVE